MDIEMGEENNKDGKDLQGPFLQVFLCQVE